MTSGTYVGSWYWHRQYSCRHVNILYSDGAASLSAGTQAPSMIQMTSLNDVHKIAPRQSVDCGADETRPLACVQFFFWLTALI